MLSTSTLDTKLVGQCVPEFTIPSISHNQTVPTKTMELNINQLVRSAVILAVGLPISTSVLIGQIPSNPVVEKSEVEALKEDLGLPCLKYALTKDDSKGEREAKNQIDEVLGVDGAEYREVCKWVLG